MGSSKLGGEENHVLNKPGALRSLHFLHQKPVESPAHTRREGRVMAAGFHNKLVWILACKAAESPKAELGKAVTSQKKKV